MKNKNKRKNRAEAITQILVLVIATFAISWMIGSEVKEVSADLSSLTSDEGCTGLVPAGTCIDTNTQSCNGDIKIGLCPGGDNIRCCVPKTTTTPPPKENNLLNTGGNIVKNTGTQVVSNALANKAKEYLTPNPIDPNKLAPGPMDYPGLLEKAGGTGTLPPANDLSKLPNWNKLTVEEKKALLDAANGAYPKTKSFKFDITQLLAHVGVALGVKELTRWLTTNMGYTENSINIGKWVVGGAYLLTAALVSAAINAGVVQGTITSAFLATKLGAGLFGGVIGLGVAAAAFLIYFGLIAKKQAVQTIIYNCYNWDAEPKGLKCELCNHQSFPCTEYQCQSLGQACELIKDTEDENYGLCVWKNPNDRKYPLIQVWEEAPFFDKANYRYIENNVIAPPDKGVYIAYTGPDRVSRGDGNIKCAPPFEPIAFGVKLDEMAMCKISPESSHSFDEMPEVYFSNGDIKYNHSLLLFHKSSELMKVELTNNYEAEKADLINEGASVQELQILNEAFVEQFELINDREYTYYIRCKDYNDNSNPSQFIFKFCISDFDGSPPVILYANPFNGSPIGYGIKQQNVKVYLNEPSECKWDRVDKSYNEMLYSMTCNNQQAIDNGQMVYTCDTVLDGLKDKQQNKFYFRCKDKPLSVFPDVKESERYTMEYSYKYVLIGTQPLVIEEVSPNATTVEDSTTPIMVDIQVKTAGGYEGESNCYISQTGQTGTYGIFAETGSNEHSQKLWLENGTYSYFIKCIDLGGNTDSGWIKFDVKIDNVPPTVVRVYKEGEYLKLITDETAECVYSLSRCDYPLDKGTIMDSEDGKEHYVEWDINKNFYIKCRDIYENLPKTGCSIIARPFEIFEV